MLKFEESYFFNLFTLYLNSFNHTFLIFVKFKYICLIWMFWLCLLRSQNCITIGY